MVPGKAWARMGPRAPLERPMLVEGLPGARAASRTVLQTGAAELVASQLAGKFSFRKFVPVRPYVELSPPVRPKATDREGGEAAGGTRPRLDALLAVGMVRPVPRLFSCGAAKDDGLWIGEDKGLAILGEPSGDEAPELNSVEEPGDVEVLDRPDRGGSVDGHP